MHGTWRFECEQQVEEFIAAQEAVVQHQMRRDMEKLGAYGLSATEPLVKHVKGSVWELRSSVDGHGFFRVFYFRDGVNSFRGFYAYQKDSKKIPRRVMKNMKRHYKELTGEKL